MQRKIGTRKCFLLKNLLNGAHSSRREMERKSSMVSSSNCAVLHGYFRKNINTIWQFIQFIKACYLKKILGDFLTFFSIFFVLYFIHTEFLVAYPKSAHQYFDQNHNVTRYAVSVSRITISIF